MGEEQVGDAVPQEQRQGWGQFLKQIATFSGDLSSLTAPSFILSPVSLVEFPAYWGEHPDDFAAISDGKDEVERIVLVLKWFIGTLKGQFTARNTSMGSEKKPLNPILGELFLGKWADKNNTGRGETTLVAEQVSHHPPITAYHISNSKAGVTYEGHCGQKTSFSGRTISVKQVGHAILRLTNHDESYLITLPDLLIEGLWYGSPYVELTSTSYIQSSAGFLVTINYSGKGYFSGKPHTFKANVSAGGSVLYTVEGDWSGKSYFRGSSPGGVRDELFVDADKPREEIQVAHISEQSPLESRRVWHLVSSGIRSADYDSASREKTRIENEQRQKRKDEAAANSPHVPLYFSHVSHDPVYSQLALKFNGKPEVQDSYQFKSTE